MVGTYAKIKNGLNWLKGKAVKYVAAIVTKPGDVADSDFMQGLAKVITPALDTAMPGRGMAVDKGLDWVGKAGAISKGLSEDYSKLGKDFSFTDAIANVATGKYDKYRTKQVLKGIQYAHRPDELHSRIQLKALPEPDAFTRTGSYVEELD
ncbi:hypothetical protein FACS189472_06490 [Alphaproteobacteria bacterium]|nr:hypothetical protein FACS189472_06490 [Alphaproteobacteria bacterium]